MENHWSGNGYAYIYPVRSTYIHACICRCTGSPASSFEGSHGLRHLTRWSVDDTYFCMARGAESCSIMCELYSYDNDSLSMYAVCVGTCALIPAWDIRPETISSTPPAVRRMHGCRDCPNFMSFRGITGGLSSCVAYRSFSSQWSRLDNYLASHFGVVYCRSGFKPALQGFHGPAESALDIPFQQVTCVLPNYSIVGRQRWLVTSGTTSNTIRDTRERESVLRRLERVRGQFTWSRGPPGRRYVLIPVTAID